MSPPILECRDIEKFFSGIPVLSGVSLQLELGTVTALAGENGAGKSTLMKIASGQYHADAGSIHVRGEQLPDGDIRAAQRSGVAIVPQELAAIEHMTVYENLFVGREIKTKLGLLDRRAMAREAAEMLSVFGVDIDPGQRMGTLPVGMQQIVEIVKNSSRGARVLLLDEPSSAIADREIEGLYRVVRRLRDQGVAMVFTTHKMGEIRSLADRIVVLRDGRMIMDSPIRETTDDDIVTAMIGRELDDLFPPMQPTGEETVLQVDDLHVEGAPEPVSLSVQRGEILGLAGLVGAGRTELIEAIFGVRPTESGTIRVAGKRVRRGRPTESIASGMALVPEDRKASGAILSMNVLDNGTLPRVGQFNVAGWLRQRARRRDVERAMESVHLRSRGLSQDVGTLSGGNQQKVVLARWLTGHVDVLLLDEPTRGVDIGARSEIYRIISTLAAEGMAVIMASSDMVEVLGMSHRALVMREGGIAGELDRTQLDRDDVQDVIFRLASGLDGPDGDDGSTPVTAVQEETL
ncbi:sugar ABC transporter ATP-binding protein [Actinobacteria bacterium YIM 96077]|uniref:Sugar ABC transporter ATP-binding protein n=1 Tax=Phytoactinopolyspora halophila TaxID=1981511 RepID=A0A329R488_9ACTN|nr:sugar ABC transporter ATP-binding protein [Phytoactinopolyspora halophila]AYY11679.1 sugar ABC transporter ATP-binding protein [Actinobacteria bacterium YIM 96077]RAW17888.1 sugar ABC transporter ATP-binding protein [Phytoactinopolyspora halophila]